MKRKREELTLWDACKVHRYGTMLHWWQSIRRKDFANQCDRGYSYTIDVEDTIRSSLSNKFAKKEVDTEKLLTSYSVGMKPTAFQKQVLNKMLRVTNYTYNWCFFPM